MVFFMWNFFFRIGSGYCRERSIEGPRKENVNTYEEIAMSTYERIKYFMKKQSEMITPMARACLIDSCTESRCLVGWWSFPGEATKPFFDRLLQGKSMSAGSAERLKEHLLLIFARKVDVWAVGGASLEKHQRRLTDSCKESR